MYFFAHKQGYCGREEYVGHQVVGWKVAFRRWQDAKFNPPMQYKRFDNPSKFGVLREIVQNGRDWFGKHFFLDIEWMKPIVRADYELIDHHAEGK